MGEVQPDREFSRSHVVDHTTSGPTVLRMVLGARLRRLRETRGISREVAADAIRASNAKICRLELGRVGFKARDVADLLTLYGVTDEQERDEFLALARRANEPGWWHQYSDIVPSSFPPYLDLEQASSVIRTYEVQFVPGLLQTPDYVRAVTQLNHLSGSAEQLERHVALQVGRQSFLSQPYAPHLWAVVDEAALRRSPASRGILHAQLRHLIEMAQLPNVTLQVMPFRRGGHAATGGPFTILRFSAPDLPDIVYLEQLTTALYLAMPLT